MYALLAICTTLSPGPTDESIMSIVKEHYADQLQTLQRGGPESLEIYKDLFLSSCPKYLSVNPPPYEDASLLEQYISNPPTDATVRHLELFLSDVEAVRGVSGVRNLLKLYTSIDASKLAAFNSVEGQGEKEILEQLMVLKGASRTYSHQTGEGSSTLLDGDRLVTNNLDFTIDAVSPSSLSNIILNSSTFYLFVEITAGLGPERLVLISGNGARRRNNLSQTIRRILYP
jgi:translation initiation factor 3 subunit L